MDIATTHEESTLEAVVYFNLWNMRNKCSHLKSLNSFTLACEIDYLSKVAGYSSGILNSITCTNLRIRYCILEAYLGLS